jgi:diguanylate cyclase (GGDEF)-like protein
MKTPKFSHSRFAREHPHLLVVGLTSIAAMIFVAISQWLVIDHLRTPGATDRGLMIAAAWAGAAILALTVSTFYGRSELHKTAQLFDNATAAKAQTDELFRMTDMLQSAEGYDDATAVLMATSLRLLPDFGAALYIFNNSRDRLDLAGSWHMPEDYRPGETLAPSNCWTLKRGKPHINVPGAVSLCCAHHTGHMAALEIPMMARGSVFGLLVFVSHDEDDAEASLSGTVRLGQALADSMSLALSNISLREKLRTQSLRDPLTGLYNRRYMEDALERFLSLAERSGTSTAVMMLDLDHFKKLNDQHGHAKGDAVLRDVAAQLVGGLRPSDVVCRYGGEELMVIMPDCSIEDARLKAESLRLRIEGLSEVHEVDVSASIGIAAVPATSTSQADVVAMADAALYQAKSNGRNCVVCAERRGTREEGPRLAATA